MPSFTGFAPTSYKRRFTFCCTIPWITPAVISTEPYLVAARTFLRHNVGNYLLYRTHLWWI